jgi:hypothetical protein
MAAFDVGRNWHSSALARNVRLESAKSLRFEARAHQRTGPLSQYTWSVPPVFRQRVPMTVIDASYPMVETATLQFVP